MLTEAFERLRPRLLAMIEWRISTKLAARIDLEGVVQESFIRAQPRWQALASEPSDLDAWVYAQVLDRFREVVTAALGPKRNVDREISAAPLAKHLVDSETGPSTALSRDERCEIVRAALEKLDPIERDILALRYFDGLKFTQIGAILGLKANTTNTRAIRAAVKLRKLIPDGFRPPGKSQP
jgi:RNA polymerase sigma-70 factor (ECF subfamily)